MVRATGVAALRERESRKQVKGTGESPVAMCRTVPRRAVGTQEALGRGLGSDRGRSEDASGQVLSYRKAPESS